MIANHYLISGILSLLLYLIYYKIKDSEKIKTLLFCILTLNFFSFNTYLLATDSFNFKTHLPLHLCYISELGILLSIIMKNKSYYSLLLLNSLGGGVTGFLNSNLGSDALLIEHIHLYISHFNLLLFSLILYIDRFYVSKNDLIKSIIMNALIFIAITIVNDIIGSNYWFTKSRPPGVNLTTILPEWPFYLFALISIGLLSYYLTFRLFLKNRDL